MTNDERIVLTLQKLHERMLENAADKEFNSSVAGLLVQRMIEDAEFRTSVMRLMVYLHLAIPNLDEMITQARMRALAKMMGWKMM